MRKQVISRTITKYNYEVMIVNDQNEVSIETVPKYSRLQVGSLKSLQEIQKTHPNAVRIMREHTESHIYEMSLEDFVANAEVVKDER